jgi:alkyl-hydroperoxide reductase/thiol specific antioxidant family protein
VTRPTCRRQVGGSRAASAPSSPVGTSAATSSDDPGVGLILVGFSPPERLAALARHLRWPGVVLADRQRVLYQRLGVGRAPLWRVYSPRTMATYATALLRGHRLARPVEDTRQLGADAIITDGTVRLLWRPRAPNDRPSGAEVVAAARAFLTS